MYILSETGIIKVKRAFFIKRMFCKHKNIEGEVCSESGMTRISGVDRVIICEKCGHISKVYSWDF